ncbi:MAG: metallophosphoesterase family protein [Nitrososphaeraceae archaeon]
MGEKKLQKDIVNSLLFVLIIGIISSLTFIHFFKNSYSVTINNDIETETEYDFIFDPNEYFEIDSEGDFSSESKPTKEKKLVKKITPETVKKQEQNKPQEEKLRESQERLYISKLVNETNSTGTHKDINIVAAGDWYCNEETKKTIKNIVQVKPELIITTGDHVKESPSAACWMEISKPIKDKMKIAIGNHDTEFASIYKQIVNHHSLKNPYYSHDFKNIHFISMSTEHPFEPGSKQYEFIKSDLEKTSKNSTIDWIIVHQHKPLYSTKQDKKEAEQLRDIYHLLFHQNNVDLVLSSHNQYYERTYPLSFNKNYEAATNKQTIPKPIITNNSKLFYQNVDGIIFLTVGTAGDELDPVTEKHDFYVVQESKFGFLNIEIENNGKTLMVKFHSNDGKIIDEFYLDKHKHNV